MLDASTQAERLQLSHGTEERHGAGRGSLRLRLWIELPSWELTKKKCGKEILLEMCGMMAIHYDYNLLLTMALMYKLTLLSFVGCVLH